jgi:hypothetical protein
MSNPLLTHRYCPRCDEIKTAANAAYVSDMLGMIFFEEAGWMMSHRAVGTPRDVHLFCTRCGAPLEEKKA